jgi:hypothetical protein
MGRLESRQLTHERVELRVADLRRVVEVVALFVVENQTAKLSDAFTDRGHGSRDVN